MTEVSTVSDLISESCPACKSTEAWHGCITEDDSTKYACDECGASMAIKPAPKPKATKARRPFAFSISIENGQFFVDFRGEAIVSFRPGWYLQVGNITIHGSREAERVEELWADGYRVGTSDAEVAS